MKQSVIDGFIRFTEPHEGYVPKMYVDVKNYVTTGYGNLIENTATGQITPQGLSLPWKRDSDGSLASRQEILDAFNTVKNSGMSQAGGGNQRHLTNIHLDRAAIVELVRQTLEGMAAKLRQYFPNFDNFPADAQLGILSMSWAMGPGFARGYPKFAAAANALVPDFVTMAKESLIPELGSPEDKPEGRNAQQIKLFLNAAKVFQTNADPDTLYWPNEVAVKAGIGIVGFAALIGGGYALLKWKGVV